jgi:hypothetical protein
MLIPLNAKDFIILPTYSQSLIRINSLFTKIHASQTDPFGSMTQPNGPKDPTIGGRSGIAPVHSPLTPDWLITRIYLLHLLHHTIHGLRLSQIFIENECGKVERWVKRPNCWVRTQQIALTRLLDRIPLVRCSMREYGCIV